MSANTVNAGVSILGCRNGLPVSKIIWKRGSGCEVVEYSDGLTDTNWIEGECTKVVYDSETTCVEENDNIYILRFSEVDGTYRVYDFSGTDVTGTVTPIKCAGAEQFDIRSAGFYCIDGTTTLERFDIIDITTSTVSSSIWQDLTGVVVSAPTGVITAGSCILDIPVGYNNVSHITATVGSPVTIPANSVHSITYQVIGSPADITIGLTTITYPSTSIGNDEATDLIVQSYTFTPTGTGTVIIRTIN